MRMCLHNVIIEGVQRKLHWERCPRTLRGCVVLEQAIKASAGLLVGDRGYNYPSVRRMLARRGIQAPKDGRYRFDPVLYRD